MLRCYSDSRGSSEFRYSLIFPVKVDIFKYYQLFRDINCDARWSMYIYRKIDNISEYKNEKILAVNTNMSTFLDIVIVQSITYCLFIVSVLVTSDLTAVFRFLGF